MLLVDDVSLAFIKILIYFYHSNLYANSYLMCVCVSVATQGSKNKNKTEKKQKKEGSECKIVYCQWVAVLLENTSGCLVMRDIFWEAIWNYCILERCQWGGRVRNSPTPSLSLLTLVRVGLRSWFSYWGPSSSLGNRAAGCKANSWAGVLEWCPKSPGGRVEACGLRHKGRGSGVVPRVAWRTRSSCCREPS